MKSVTETDLGHFAAWLILSLAAVFTLIPLAQADPPKARRMSLIVKKAPTVKPIKELNDGVVGGVIVENDLEQQRLERIILRHDQLWNLYERRTEIDATDSERKSIQTIRDSARPPRIHASMKPDVVHAAVSAAAEELRSRLIAEIAQHRDAGDTAAMEKPQRNLAYLQNELLAGLRRPTAYTMVKTDFQAEFEKVHSNPSAAPVR